MNICLDSQCLTYLLDALEGTSEPSGQLAIEKTSLVRIFFYVAHHFEITPKVEDEALQIRDKSRRKKHKSWIDTHFAPRQFWKDVQHKLVEEQCAAFHKLHRGEADCQILAEAEGLEFSTLLSYDFDFVDNLSNHTTIDLLRPSEYWKASGVPKGTELLTSPGINNPLYSEKWWKW